MTVIKRILLTVFLAVTGLSLSAQEKPDSTAYRFRFVAENDMFFSPWSGNGQELERLLAAIDEHRPAIEAGQMYLLVTSYATDGNEEQTAAQVAKTRRNRVKSELIVRGKIKESNFVTDQLFDEAYTDGNGKSLHNMVIVTLPASVEKVAEIAGAEAAARVEAYNKEVSGEAERERMAAKEQAKAEQTAKEKAEQERIAAEQAAREKAEAERMERERMAAEQVEKERLEAEEQARLQAEETAIATPYHFALRANLLRWATRFGYRVAHQPPCGYCRERYVGFMELGRQEPPLCPLGSGPRSAMVSRQGETGLYRCDVQGRAVQLQAVRNRPSGRPHGRWYRRRLSAETQQCPFS